MFRRNSFVFARDTDWYVEIPSFRDACFFARFAKETDWYIAFATFAIVFFFLSKSTKSIDEVTFDSLGGQNTL